MNYSALFMPIITLIISQITVLDLAQFRFNLKKMATLLSLEFIVQVVLNVTSLLFLGIEGYAKLYFLTMHLPAFITFYYVSRRRDMKDFFTILVTIFINFAVSIPGLWISQLLGSRYLWYNILRIVIFAGVWFLLHKFVRKRYIQLQDEIEHGWGIYCILPVFCSAALYYEYLQYSIHGVFSDVAWECAMTILIMTAVFTVFNYVFTQLHEKYLVQEQKSILDMQNKAQREQFEHHKEETEKANRRWHDLRHTIQELIELLEAGQTEQAISYLKEQRGLDYVPKEEYCLHPAVNSILCLWAERSRKAGIEVEISVDVPENLDIEPMELSALFANAFENAYEGCMKLPASESKRIKVEANYNGKRLAVGFTNTCKEDMRFNGTIPESSKKDGGIGIRSMAYTAKRYQGMMYLWAEDGIFSARFILYI